MTLVVGLGCQRGCDVDTLLGLFDSALAEGGVERQRVTALASIDRKQNEPGLLALARLLDLPLQCFSAGQLRIRRWPLTVINSGSPGPAPMK